MRFVLGGVFRRLRVRPWLPLVSLALLGAAVGFHTAVFAALDIVLLRPLPFPDPGRLVVITERKGDADDLSTLGNYRDFQRARLPFDALGAYASADPALFISDAPQSLEVLRVTSSLFRALGAAPARGRVFTQQEEEGSARVAILTDSGWTRYFGRGEVVGSRVELDGVAFSVIGVASPQVGRVLRADVLLPFPRLQTGRGERVVHLIGRLADGVTIAAARDAMTQRVAALEAIARENDRFRAASVVSLQETWRWSIGLSPNATGPAVTPRRTPLGATSRLLPARGCT